MDLFVILGVKWADFNYRKSNAVQKGELQLIGKSNSNPLPESTKTQVITRKKVVDSSPKGIFMYICHWLDKDIMLIKYVCVCVCVEDVPAQAVCTANCAYKLLGPHRLWDRGAGGKIQG